jgi:hypothetical protein
MTLHYKYPQRILVQSKHHHHHLIAMVTCSHHDLAEKLHIWSSTINTHTRKKGKRNSNKDRYKTMLKLLIDNNNKDRILNSQTLGSTPGSFGRVCVGHLFSFLCFLLFLFWLCFVCLRPVSYVQCCQSLWIVHSWLLLRFSLMFFLQHQTTNELLQLF